MLLARSRLGSTDLSKQQHSRQINYPKYVLHSQVSMRKLKS